MLHGDLIFADPTSSLGFVGGLVSKVDAGGGCWSFGKIHTARSKKISESCVCFELRECLMKRAARRASFAFLRRCRLAKVGTGSLVAKKCHKSTWAAIAQSSLCC